MNLDILDRYDSESRYLRHSVVHWRDDTITPRSAIRRLPKAPQGQIQMNGTVGTSAAIAAMLSEAADRIERRHAETTAENRGESACTTLADNIKDVDELALQYREASQDARDHHRIWIAEPDKQSPLYPTRPHEPDTPQVVIHPDGIVRCIPATDGVPQTEDTQILGYIESYRRAHPYPTFWPTVDGPRPTESEEPVIERREPSLDHPVVRNALHDAWHDYISTWLASAWHANCNRMSELAAVYRDARQVTS